MWNMLPYLPDRAFIDDSVPSAPGFEQALPAGDFFIEVRHGLDLDERAFEFGYHDVAFSRDSRREQIVSVETAFAQLGIASGVGNHAVDVHVIFETAVDGRRTVLTLAAARPDELAGRAQTIEFGLRGQDAVADGQRLESHRAKSALRHEVDFGAAGDIVGKRLEELVGKLSVGEHQVVGDEIMVALADLAQHGQLRVFGEDKGN